MSGHHHREHHSPKSVSKLWIIFGLVTAYMIAEIVGGVFSGSLVLLADAGHMAIDAAATAMGLFAAWIATKPADSEKTYGYYRAEILGALVNGALLFAVAGWIFFEGYQRLQVDTAIRGDLMTGVAAGGLLVNVVSLLVVRGERSKSINYHAVWLHIATDTLGSIAALVAGMMVWLFDWTRADALISLFIAGLILIGAWQLVSECVNVLLEAVPKGMKLGDIREGIQRIPGVAEVHDLHVWTLTTGVPSLSAHIRIDSEGGASRVLTAITAFLREKYHIEHVTVQLEPPDFVHKALHV